MTAEISALNTDHHIRKVEFLESFLLSTIVEQNDGLCLDNKTERVRLASALTLGLLDAVDDRVINLSLLLAGPALLNTLPREVLKTVLQTESPFPVSRSFAIFDSEEC